MSKRRKAATKRNTFAEGVKKVSVEEWRDAVDRLYDPGPRQVAVDLIPCILVCAYCGRIVEKIGICPYCGASVYPPE